MSDLLTDARETLADISSRRPGQTHYAGCRTAHVGCLLADLIEEVERLRGYRDEAEAEASIASLAVQRLRLTDAEREAVETSFDAMQYAADELGLSQADCDRLVATLRGLLERQQSTQPTHTTPNECTVCPKRTSLTDAERDAISLMAEVAADPRGGAVLDGYKVAATLRGLLERLC